MENIEEILGIKTYPMNWPIGCGKEFKGVFDRNERKVLAFSSDGRANGVKKVKEVQAEKGDAALDELLTPYLHQQLVDEIELLDGAAEEFDLEKVRCGELSPVFFGSALTNFGVEPFLENFLRLTSSPLARVDSLTGEAGGPLRGGVLRLHLQDPGQHEQGPPGPHRLYAHLLGQIRGGAWRAFHVQQGKNIKLATGTQLMAQDRAIVDEPMQATSSACLTRASSPSVTPCAPAKRRCSLRASPPSLRSILPDRAEGHHEAQAVH